MNALAKINTIKIMTSLEICELTGKRHADTLRLIQSLIDTGLISTTQFALCSYKDSNQRDRPMYSLDKTASILVVARQSPEFTAALVERWSVLEDRAWMQDNKDEQKEINTLFHNLLETDKSIQQTVKGKNINSILCDHLGVLYLEKEDMPLAMKELRNQIDKEYVKLYDVIGSKAKVHAILKDKYPPKLLEQSK